MLNKGNIIKILIDPIYTGYVNKCASAVKHLRCVQRLMEYADDVFFYWLVPDNMTDEEVEWLPISDRITYIPMPYFEDRYKEYWHSSEEWRRLVSFNGSHWDVDVVVTNRTSLTPYLKWAMVRPGGMLSWSKRVFLIEDMPTMSFKMFIPQSSEREGDISSLAGYLSADKTCISAYWEKKHIIDIGRRYLSAASLRYLSNTIVEATHHAHSVPMLKSPEALQLIATKQKKFTISYAGRMVNRDFVDDSFDILLKHWILGGNDVRILLCTVSKNFGRVKHPAVDKLEVFHPNRDEFWRIMREEADVGVFMSRDEDYSMVMMEPLMQGTPLVLYRAEHAIASVGEDYPFFVNSVKEGFAVVKKFRTHYLEMYEKFSQWSQTSFKSLLEERNKSYLPDYLVDTCETWRGSLATEGRSLLNNDIVQLIASKAQKGIPFHVVEVIKSLEKEGKIRGDISSKENTQFDGLRITFSTHFDVYRVGLLGMGFKDAAPQPGWMVLP